MPGADAKDRLLQMATQAGISKDEFDKCLADKELFDKIVEVRTRGNEEFQVDSTPSFFVNGKRLTGDHHIKDFDIALGEAPAEEKSLTLPMRRPGCLQDHDAGSIGPGPRNSDESMAAIALLLGRRRRAFGLRRRRSRRRFARGDARRLQGAATSRRWKS